MSGRSRGVASGDVAAANKKLTVAVTGPTGTFGFGLMPLLEANERIGRIIGLARRPFSPSEHGWTKMEYRQGDVREPGDARGGVRGADVVVHLAFMITGNASRETIRAINVEGTLNTFRAAAASAAKRFVYASSVAAYGFHRDNPVGMTRGLARAPRRPALLRAGEGGDRALLEDAAPTTRSSGSTCCGRRSSSGRTRWGPSSCSGRLIADRGAARRLGARAHPCRCRCRRRRCRCSSSTRRTSARRSCSASSARALPAPTTSPATA